MGKYIRCSNIKLQFKIFPLKLEYGIWKPWALVKYTKSLNHKIQRPLPMQTQIGTTMSESTHQPHHSTYQAFLHPSAWRRQLHHWPRWKCLDPAHQRGQARNISHASAQQGWSDKLVHTCRRDHKDVSENKAVYPNPTCLMWWWNFFSLSLLQTREEDLTIGFWLHKNHQKIKTFCYSTRDLICYLNTLLLGVVVAFLGIFHKIKS